MECVHLKEQPVRRQHIPYTSHAFVQWDPRTSYFKTLKVQGLWLATFLRAVREVDLAKSKDEESRVRLMGDCNPWVSKMIFGDFCHIAQDTEKDCWNLLLTWPVIAMLQWLVMLVSSIFWWYLYDFDRPFSGGINFLNFSQNLYLELSQVFCAKK
jgi:hypothetical protein